LELQPSLEELRLTRVLIHGKLIRIVIRINLRNVASIFRIAALMHKNRGYFCGGTLITKRLVLTGT
jgi:hypothetical protein